MAACSIFDEDQVCLVTPNRFRYGLVLENAEYLSSDDDNDEFPDNVRRGTVRVAWHPMGRETVVSENEVVLADRSLMPGDVVRRSRQGEDNQRGFVQDMEVTCHLRILGSNTYIYNVNSKDVLSMEEWVTDPGEVTLDSWFGRIMMVHEDLELKFQDGARCVIDDGEFCGFEDTVDNKRGHTEFANRHYYEKQVLRGVMSDLSEAKWTNPTKKYNVNTTMNKPSTSVTVTVESVTTSSVEVHWLCRGFTKGISPQDKLDPPSRMVKGEELKRMKTLHTFEHCSLQIGDKGFYVIKDTDFLSDISPKQYCPPYQSQNPSGAGEANQLSGSKDLKNNPENDTELVKTDSSENTPNNCKENGDLDESSDDYEDVETDEHSDAGSINSDHSSLDGTHKKRQNRKGPILQTRLRKKFKGKGTKKPIVPKLFNPNEKVPVEIYYTFSKISVMWQDGSVEKDIPSPELIPIHHLDDLEFFPGDFTIHNRGEFENNYGVVLSCDHRERLCSVKWMKPYEGNSSTQGERNRPVEVSGPVEVSVYDIKDHTDYRFRPGQSVIRIGGFDDEDELEAVGQIFHLDPEGVIHVQWPSGRVSECYPQELYIVSDENSDFDGTWSSVDEDDEEEDSDISWETESEEEVNADSDDEKSLESDWLKDELVKVKERAQFTLIKLQTLCELVGDGFFNVTQCFQDLLSVYRKCKDLEKILKSSFFEDPDVVKMVAEVKEALRTERTSRVLQNVMRHVNKVPPHRSMAPSSGHSEHSAAKDKNQETESVPSVGRPSNLSNHVPHIDDAPLECGRTICDSDATVASSKSSVTDSVERSMPKALLPNGPIALDSSKNTSTNDLECNGIEPHASSGCDEKLRGCDLTTDTFCTNLFNTGLEEGSPGNANRDLCLRLCRLLNEKMLAIHLEASKRWAEAKQNKIDNDNKDTNPKCNDDENLDSERVKDASDNPVLAAVADTSDPAIKETSDSSCEVVDLGENCAEKPAEGIKDKIISELLDSLSDTVPLCESPKSPEIELGEAESAATESRGFHILEEVPDCHKFKSLNCHPTDPKYFTSSVRKEMLLLRTSLPVGITVKAFEDRMDLFSVMVVGPSMTPYEDGLFFFDIRLPPDYPVNPPVFHYHSYCSERLNPNLYEDGKVCVSLLGTWSGKGTEMWTPKSNMLQALVSIQGLILVGEPYYNEAGYEKQRGTQQGQENSRMYNEMAILKLVQSMSQIANRPPAIFEEETKKHMLENGPRMIKRLQSWIGSGNSLSKSSKPDQTSSPDRESSAGARSPDSGTISGACANKDSSLPDLVVSDPEFSLLPTSKGFCMAVARYLQQFQSVLEYLRSNLH
ncbi:hypothetical protein ScPMuIL_004415 [Solemya velum]